MGQMFEEMPSNPMEHDKYVPEVFHEVGKRGVRRIDGYRKASGQAVYTRDIQLPGMLYAKFLTSPYPNARIKNMDTGKAEALLGVRGILRYDDPEIRGKKITSTQGSEEETVSVLLGISCRAGGDVRRLPSVPGLSVAGAALL